MNKLLLAVLPLIAASFASGQQIQATVDGQQVHFADVKPVSMHGRVYVPVRGVFEQMGVYVDWEPATRSVYARGHGNEVLLHIGQYTAQVNGETRPLDAAPMIYRGRTMVPLRFVSESMGAEVNWDTYTNTVAIWTGAVAQHQKETYGGRAEAIRTTVIRADTVIPVTLNERLSSKTARQGDPFTATLDLAAGKDYMGLPAGTVVEGHIDAVRPLTGDTPGVLGLAFDRLRFPDGRVVDLDASLVGLDSKSVENKDGRLVAKQVNRDMKYVGIGAGAGALIAIISRNNVLTSTIIGAALGYLYDQSQMKERKDVVLKSGSSFGVALNSDLEIPAY